MQMTIVEQVRAAIEEEPWSTVRDIVTDTRLSRDQVDVALSALRSGGQVIARDSVRRRKNALGKDVRAECCYQLTEHAEAAK
jgi:DNA-binding transcriptional ArsR family regulator